ncbi:Helicase swr1 [Trichinella pseudospiralis]
MAERSDCSCSDVNRQINTQDQIYLVLLLLLNFSSFCCLSRKEWSLNYLLTNAGTTMQNRENANRSSFHHWIKKPAGC